MSDIIKISGAARDAKGHPWRPKVEKASLWKEREVTKHSDFDKMWESYRSFIFWWAKRMSKAFGGEADDYVGNLVLRLNRVLYTYDPTRGKFTTYYSTGIHDEMIRVFLRFESEHRAIYWMAVQSTDDEIKSVGVNYAFHEADFHLYRIPDCDDDWADEIISNFESPEECWKFLMKGINNRERAIVRSKCEGKTLEAIGIEYDISKERVRQLYYATLKKIRERLQALEKWNDLFSMNL